MLKRRKLRTSNINCSNKNWINNKSNEKITKDNIFRSKIKVVLKEEFLRFCKTTTLRGVPKIINSKSKTLRYMWLTFFLLLLTGLLICFIFLLKQYFAYDVIHPPRILTNNQGPFPSFTVCNLRPLARNIQDILKHKQLKTPRAFAKIVNQYAIKNFHMKNNHTLYGHASSIMSMGGYLESISNKSYSDLGHKKEDLIIHCQVTYMIGSKPHSNDCDNIGSWRRIVHAQYVNCYMYNLNDMFINSTNTLEMFIYLDESINQTTCIDCFPSDVKSQLSGALILIHRSQTFPNFNRDMINLQPGTLTEFKIKIIHNRQKLPPYGRCSHKTPKSIKVYEDFYTYSEDLCKLMTLQVDLNQYCNCNAIEYPFNRSNYQFCSALPRFSSNSTCNKLLNDTKCDDELREAVKRISCKAKASLIYNNDIVPSCKLPCSFYSYESDRSISTWPTKSWQLQWIGTKAAKPLQNKSELNIYRYANNLQSRGNHKEALELLKKEDTLEHKILAVMINRPNYNVHLVEEKEVLSLTSFLSQAGGLFSIFIGLTLFSIVEIFEMFVNCFWRYRNFQLPINNDQTKIISQKSTISNFHSKFSSNDANIILINPNTEINSFYPNHSNQPVIENVV